MYDYTDHLRMTEPNKEEDSRPFVDVEAWITKVHLAPEEVRSEILWHIATGRLKSIPSAIALVSMLLKPR